METLLTTDKQTTEETIFNIAETILLDKCAYAYDNKQKHFDMYKWIKTRTNALRAKEIVIVCVGTDRSTGDCLGPMVGTKLKDYIVKDTYLYGTIDDTVNGTNLAKTREMIMEKHPDAFIIAIDASLGRSEQIGFVSVKDGPLRPGAGVNKDLGTIGDICITGIVNISGFMEYVVLQNTKLSLVMNMADTIVDNMVELLNSYQYVSAVDRG